MMIPGKNRLAPRLALSCPQANPRVSEVTGDSRLLWRSPALGMEDVTLSFAWPLLASGSKWRQSGRFGKKDIFKWSWLFWLLHETGKCIGLAKRFVWLMNIFNKVLCENEKKKEVSHFYLKSNELFGQASKYWPGNVLGIRCDFLFKSNPVLGFTWHFTWC